MGSGGLLPHSHHTTGWKCNIFKIVWVWWLLIPWAFYSLATRWIQQLLSHLTVVRKISHPHPSGVNTLTEANHYMCAVSDVTGREIPRWKSPGHGHNGGMNTIRSVLLEVYEFRPPLVLSRAGNLPLVLCNTFRFFFLVMFLCKYLSIEIWGCGE